MSDIPLGGAALILRTNDKQLDKGIARARRKSAQLSRDFAKVGRSITASLTLPIVGLGAVMAKASLDFESSLSQITGLVGVADDQVKEWRKDIIALGPAVAKGPGELADAMFFIASAGIKGSEALEVLTATAKAAASGLGETKVVADAVTSAMNAYGSNVLDAAKATNILVGAVKLGKRPPEEIAAAIGRVLPLASQMGVTFDQVAAVLASMSKTGTVASESMTSLNSLLVSLNKVTPQSEDALSKLGLSSAGLRQQIKEGGLLDALTDMKDKIGDNTEAWTEIFPRFEGVKAILALVGAGADEVKGIFAELATNTSNLDLAFAAAAKTGRFKLDASMSRIKASLIAVGDVVLVAVVPIFEKLSIFISNVADRFRALTPEMQGLIVKVGLLVAALGPALLIISGLFSLLSLLISPVVLVGAAIAALTVLAVRNWDTIKVAAEDLFNTVKKWFVDNLIPAIQMVREKMQPVVDFFIRNAGLIGDAFALLVSPIIIAVALIGFAVKELVGVVVENWDTIVTATKGMYEGIRTWLVDNLGGIFEWVLGALSTFKDAFFKLVKTLSFGKLDLSKLQESVATGLKGTLKQAKPLLKNLQDAAKDSFGETSETALTAFAGMKAGITKTLSELFTDTTKGFKKLEKDVGDSNDAIVENTEAAVPKVVSKWKEGILQLSDLLNLFADSVGTVFEVMIDGSQRMAETKRANAEALTEARVSNAEAVADVTTTNADALASVKERNAKALADVNITDSEAVAAVKARNAQNITDTMARNSEALNNVQENNAKSLNNIMESNADAVSNIKQSNVDAVKGIIIKVLSLLQGMIVASAAANQALSLAWVPGGIVGILAALVALEGAKALVRNVKFAHGGIATPQGSLITANNATANVAEAGRSEVFMPLTRMANGDLGVASGGGGAGSGVSIQVTVQNSVLGNRRAVTDLIEPVLVDLSKKLQSKLASRA